MGESGSLTGKGHMYVGEFPGWCSWGDWCRDEEDWDRHVREVDS